ncbi:MAG: hypothetical protein MUO85_03635 [candidate division Zixibacteria bacterium]|nr:hypothetical protein [candidate division Zixibacteria bacterium]
MLFLMGIVVFSQSQTGKSQPSKNNEILGLQYGLNSLSDKIDGISKKMDSIDSQLKDIQKTTGDSKSDISSIKGSLSILVWLGPTVILLIFGAMGFLYVTALNNSKKEDKQSTAPSFSPSLDIIRMEIQKEVEREFKLKFEEKKNS